MKILTSSNLIAADRFMDRYGLSFVNNFVNSISKVCMSLYQCFCEDGYNDRYEDSSLKYYWTYIDEKEKSTCALGLIPIPGVGSVLIYLKNKREKAKGEELFEKYMEIYNQCKESAASGNHKIAMDRFSKSEQYTLRKNHDFIKHMIVRVDEYYDDDVRAEQRYELGWLNTEEEEANAEKLQEGNDTIRYHAEFDKGFESPLGGVESSLEEL